MGGKTTPLPAWNAEADFVVLGSGAAGLTGALVAALEGLSVIVLEKTDLVGGTTSLSGGAMWIPLNHHAAEVGVDDTRDEALAYVRACAGEAGDDEILVALVDNGSIMVRELESKADIFFRPWPSEGCGFDYHSDLPGAKHGGRTLDPGKFTFNDLGAWRPRLRTGSQSAWRMDRLDIMAKRLHVAPPGPGMATRLLAPGEAVGDYLAAGSALTGQLLKACLRHGVDIHTGTPAAQLILDQGNVAGVQADRAGEAWFVRARHGVLVATGGYTHNTELARLWLDRPIDFSCEIAGNRGDGHLMGIAAGAQVAGLGDAWWYMQGAPHINRYVPHSIIVNKDAQRFCDESMNYYDFGAVFGSRKSGIRNLPAWLLFDGQGVSKYTVLADILTVAPRADYVQVGAAAYTAPTRVVQAESLEKLAVELGIDGNALQATVNRFNQHAQNGVDVDFHRGETPWSIGWGDPNQRPNPSLGELTVPPFYAVEIRSGALATRGGLRVNKDGQVLAAASGAPLEGLFAAGNCSSGAVPQSYPGFGATIGAAMTFAYLAAKKASTKARRRSMGGI